MENLNKQSSLESQPLTTFTPSPVNETAWQRDFEIQSDSRKTILTQVTNNSLETSQYLEILEYLELAEKRRFIHSTKQFVEAHRRTLEKLAKR